MTAQPGNSPLDDLVPEIQKARDKGIAAVRRQTLPTLHGVPAADGIEGAAASEAAAIEELFSKSARLIKGGRYFSDAELENRIRDTNYWIGLHYPIIPEGKPWLPRKLADCHYRKPDLATAGFTGPVEGERIRPVRQKPRSIGAIRSLMARPAI